MDLLGDLPAFLADFVPALGLGHLLTDSLLGDPLNSAFNLLAHLLGLQAADLVWDIVANLKGDFLTHSLGDGLFNHFLNLLALCAGDNIAQLVAHILADLLDDLVDLRDLDGRAHLVDDLIADGVDHRAAVLDSDDLTLFFWPQFGRALQLGNLDALDSFNLGADGRLIRTGGNRALFLGRSRALFLLDGCANIVGHLNGCALFLVLVNANFLNDVLALLISDVLALLLGNVDSLVNSNVCTNIFMDDFADLILDLMAHRVGDGLGYKLSFFMAFGFGMGITLFLQDSFTHFFVLDGADFLSDGFIDWYFHLIALLYLNDIAYLIGDIVALLFLNDIGLCVLDFLTNILTLLNLDRLTFLMKSDGATSFIVVLSLVHHLGGAGGRGRGDFQVGFVDTSVDAAIEATEAVVNAVDVIGTGRPAVGPLAQGPALIFGFKEHMWTRKGIACSCHFVFLLVRLCGRLLVLRCIKINYRNFRDLFVQVERRQL